MTVEVGALKDHLIMPLPQGRCGPCSTTPGPHGERNGLFLFGSRVASLIPGVMCTATTKVVNPC